MSVVHAFFTQRRKELASGQVASDADTVRDALGESVVSSIQDGNSHKQIHAGCAVKRRFHIAVQGCCHGELGRVYEACAYHEQQTGKKIDLLICCGDFQATRNYADLASMAVPDKYKAVGSFPNYYSPVMTETRTVSEAKANDEARQAGRANMSSANSRVGMSAHTAAAAAPYLTLFIGGNHENSDWLAEESYGGFLAPNIYYIGHSGVIVVDGALRIAGLSGIYKAADYTQPYPSRPYEKNEHDKRSAYHVRRIEIEKLHAYLALRQRTPQIAPVVDIFLSHDWPVGITKFGNEEQLLRYKPYFRDDIAHKALGNPYTMALLNAAQPRYWFAAHLHCRFEATIHHDRSDRDSCCADRTLGNDRDTTWDRRDPVESTDDSTLSSKATSKPAAETRFVALDKCGRTTHSFLDFFDVDVEGAAQGGGSSDGGVAHDRPTAQPLSPPVCAGADRVCRDGDWVRVLQASHAFVAQNRVDDVASRRSHGGARGKDKANGDACATPAQRFEEFGAQAMWEKIMAFANDSVPDAADMARPGSQHDKGKSVAFMDSEVLFAPTTGCLLDALGLSRAVPLQQKEQQQKQHALGARASYINHAQQRNISNSAGQCVEQTSVELPSLSWSVDLGSS